MLAPLALLACTEKRPVEPALAKTGRGPAAMHDLGTAASPSVVLAGTVRDQIGHPVAGAVVAVVATAAYSVAQTKRSGGDGRFRFTGLPAARYAITATSRELTGGYRGTFSLDVAERRSDIELVLGGQGFTLAGCVRDSGGHGIGRASVVAQRFGAQEGEFMVTRTDARGTYAMKLSRGYYAVFVMPSHDHDGPPNNLNLEGDTPLDFDLLPSYPTGRAAPAEVQAWIAKNAIRLSTCEAGSGFADLPRFRDIVGDARLVGLGEATHGGREFFRLKHRIVEFLVVELGFTALAIEAGFAEALAVNDYVRTGKGDPVAAVKGLRFPWDTQEVLELVRWMRHHNMERPDREKVSFYGFDMRFPMESARAVEAYLREVDPGYAPEAEPVLASFESLERFRALGQLGETERAATSLGLEGIIARLVDRESTYVAKSGVEKWRLIRQHARVLEQADRRALAERDPGHGAIELRDRAMAENARALLELEAPNARIVLWTHNSHVSRHGQPSGVRSMGANLAEWFGERYAAFGFAFNQGSFRAVGTRTGEIADHTVPEAPLGSLDQTLASIGAPLLAIDLRTADGLVGHWLDSLLRTRTVGGTFNEASPHLINRAPRKHFDALLFVRTITPVQALETR